jgi:hypothetical protein
MIKIKNQWQERLEKLGFDPECCFSNHCDLNLWVNPWTAEQNTDKLYQSLDPNKSYWFITIVDDDYSYPWEQFKTLTEQQIYIIFKSWREKLKRNLRGTASWGNVEISFVRDHRKHLMVCFHYHGIIEAKIARRLNFNSEYCYPVLIKQIRDGDLLKVCQYLFKPPKYIYQRGGGKYKYRKLTQAQVKSIYGNLQTYTWDDFFIKTKATNEQEKTNRRYTGKNY